MTTAYSTTANAYRVTAERPTYCGGDITPGIRKGDLVTVRSSYGATPDPDGDLSVKVDRTGGVTYIAASQLAPVVTVGGRYVIADGAPTDCGRPGDVVIARRLVDSDGDVYVDWARGSRMAYYVPAKYLTPAPITVGRIDASRITAGSIFGARIAEPFKVGDRVRVAYPAKTVGGGGVYFGREVVGKVTSARANGDYSVTAPGRHGGRVSQSVAPAYLTKLAAEPEVEDDKVSIEAMRKAWAVLDVALLERALRDDDAMLDLHLNVAAAIEAGVS